MSELQREYDETAKATLPAAMAAAKLHARPDRASMILVGDRAKIEGKVRDLKVGDVVVVDAEGRPVRRCQRRRAPCADWSFCRLRSRFLSTPASIGQAISHAAKRCQASLGPTSAARPWAQTSSAIAPHRETGWTRPSVQRSWMAAAK